MTKIIYYIISGLALILAIYKGVKEKPEPDKKIQWYLGWIIPSLICLAFFIKPLTEKSFIENMCEWEEYQQDVKETTSKENVTEEDLLSLKETANCVASLAQTAFDSGLVDIGLGNYNDAIIHLNYSISAQNAIDNKDSLKISDIYFYLGSSYQFLQEYSVAIEKMTLSINYAPNNVSAWIARGLDYNYLGKRYLALESLERAIKMDPKSSIAWLNCGVVYRDMQKLDSALICYDKAILYQYNNVDAWFNKGNIHKLYKEFEKAIECYDMAIKFYRSDYQAWTNRGLVFHYMNENQHAIESFDSALVYSPNNKMILNYRNFIANGNVLIEK